MRRLPSRSSLSSVRSSTPLNSLIWLPGKTGSVGCGWGDHLRRRLVRVFTAATPRALALGEPRLCPGEQPLIRPDRARRALAVTDAALAADLDLQNFLPRSVIDDDFHVAMLQVFGLVGTKPRISHEQHVVVHLLSIPAIVIMERLLRIRARRLIELLVLLRTEPGSMDDLALRPVWRRQIR